MVSENRFPHPGTLIRLGCLRDSVTPRHSQRVEDQGVSVGQCAGIIHNCVGVLHFGITYNAPGFVTGQALAVITWECRGRSTLAVH